MKKFTIIAVTLLILFSKSESQLIRGYGIKVGMATTNQQWNYASYTSIIVNSSPRQGIDAGIFAEWFDIPIISLLTEVHYIQKGADSKTNILVSTSDDPNDPGHNYTFSSKVDYLSVPMLAKIRLDAIILTPYILIGPRFDFYLKNRSDGIGVNLNNSKKIDIGGTLGFGFELSSILPINLGAEFRYNPNFKDSYSVSYLTVNNRSWELLLVLSY